MPRPEVHPVQPLGQSPRFILLSAAPSGRCARAREGATGFTRKLAGKTAVGGIVTGAADMWMAGEIQAWKDGSGRLTSCSSGREAAAANPAPDDTGRADRAQRGLVLRAWGGHRRAGVPAGDPSHRGHAPRCGRRGRGGQVGDRLLRRCRSWPSSGSCIGRAGSAFADVWRGRVVA